MAFARRDGDHKPVGGPSARLILVTLMARPLPSCCGSGLIMQGLVAGIVVVALPITARTLRPGETGFLVSTICPLAPVAALTALWVLVQVLPLRVLAHPIWKSGRQRSDVRLRAELRSIRARASSRSANIFP
jgi:hypothetical protein